MKKALFIMAAALLTMTQCRKENATPNMPADGAVKMTVTAGPGRTGINTETGAITWSAGDKLYVSDGTNWLGSLTLVSGAGTANGTFSGSVTGLDDEGAPCHFFYLGHDNGMAELTGTDAANISLASQDGTLAGAMKYHIGHGNTNVTVESGEYAGYVKMDTKIAIAHINFTTDGTTAYTGAVTMGGTGIRNTLSVSPNGNFSGSGTDGITIGATTTGEKYVTLIPTTETDRVDVTFTGDATGSMTFLAGISENKFYGMKDAMTVTLTPKPKFSVGENTTVEFAPGNLYWDGSAFHFEANQWSSASTWDANHVSHFFWSNTTDWQVSDKEPYAASYSYSTRTTSDVFFTNSKETPANPNFQVNGETAGTWHTLSNAEWDYLLNSRTNASSLRAWKNFGNNVKGLVILPDGTDASVMSSISSTEALASSGAVFLPAAGYRNNGTKVDHVGSYGRYWSSTPYEDFEASAYGTTFDSGNVGTGSVRRNLGYAVRLVRE